MTESIQNTAGMLAVILLIVWAAVDLALYLERRRARKKKFTDTFERAKARMERARELSGAIDTALAINEKLPPLTPNDPAYFKSEAEAREFKDWVMSDEDAPGLWSQGAKDTLRDEYETDAILDAEVVEEKE